MDPTGSWDRILLACGFPSLVKLAEHTDPDQGGNSAPVEWGGLPVSPFIASSQALAESLCDLYGFESVQPEVLAVALLADPRSSASLAFTARAELGHAELLRLVQLELTGGEWDGLEEAILSHSKRVSGADQDSRETPPTNSGLDARIRWAEQRVRALEDATRRALMRSDAASADDDAATAERFEAAAENYVEQLLDAERTLDGLRRARDGGVSADPSAPLDAERDLEVVTAFVSYSRHDYYVAEALHSSLSKSADVRPWMDVTELRLGSDWARAVDDALEAADVLVLVTSPAAMASEQVTREWRAAVERNVPVVVAAAAWTPPHPQLRPAAVHDLRSDFGTASEDVRRSVLAAAAGRTDAAPGQLARRYRLPLPVLLVLLCAFFDLLVISLALACAVASVVSPAEPLFRINSPIVGAFTAAFSGVAAYGPLLLCAVSLAITCMHIVTVVRRRIKPQPFCAELLLPTAVFALTTVLLLALRRRQNISQVELAPPVVFALSAWLPLLVGLGVSAAIAIVTVLRSKALLRITLSGYDLPRLRRRVTGEAADHSLSLDFATQALQDETIERMSSRVRANPKQLSFHLLCEPQDRGFGEIIRKACRAAGLTDRDDGYA